MDVFIYLSKRNQVSHYKKAGTRGLGCLHFQWIASLDPLGSQEKEVNSLSVFGLAEGVILPPKPTAL